jgi:hypothetical protein
MRVGLVCLSLGSGKILLKLVADRIACFLKIKQFIDPLMICLPRLPPAGKPIAVKKYIISYQKYAFLHGIGSISYREMSLKDGN